MTTQIETNEKKAWIFQANPTKYKILDALDWLNKIEWRVTRYSNEIKLGDIVYIWLSGPTAGIYAKTVVVEAPTQEKPKRYDRCFELSLEENKENVFAVLKIEKRYIKNPLLKSDILAHHPHLQELEVIRMPQATNYKVKQEEFFFIDGLLNCAHLED
jgi:hypothetical protein